VKRTIYEAPHYAVFSTIPQLLPYLPTHVFSIFINEFL